MKDARVERADDVDLVLGTSDLSRCYASTISVREVASRFRDEQYSIGVCCYCCSPGRKWRSKWLETIESHFGFDSAHFPLSTSSIHPHLVELLFVKFVF